MSPRALLRFSPLSGSSSGNQTGQHTCRKKEFANSHDQQVGPRLPPPVSVWSVFHILGAPGLTSSPSQAVTPTDDPPGLAPEMSQRCKASQPSFTSLSVCAVLFAFQESRASLNPTRGEMLRCFLPTLDHPPPRAGRAVRPAPNPEMGRRSHGDVINPERSYIPLPTDHREGGRAVPAPPDAALQSAGSSSSAGRGQGGEVSVPREEDAPDLCRLPVACVTDVCDTLNNLVIRAT